MKKVFLFALLGLLLLQSNLSNAQQLSLLNQYMFNGLYINPAYAGYKGDFFTHAFFRSQWIGVTGAPQTLAIGSDIALADEHVGLGLVVTSDRDGASRTNMFLSNYAYWVHLNRDLRLSFGLALGGINYGLDGSILDPNEPGDPFVATVRYNLWLPEACAGMYLTSNRFYLGLSALNMISRYMPVSGKEENRYIVRNYNQYMLTVGGLITLSEQLDLKPSFLIREDLHNPTVMDVNLMMLVSKTFWVGASYRMSATFGKEYHLDNDYQSSALALIVDVYATENFRVGYSFDFDFSKVSRYSGGNHEISLGYNISSLRKEPDRRRAPRLRHF